MNAPTLPTPPGRRLLFLKISWGIVLALALVIRFIPDLERNFSAWLTALLFVLGGILTLIWFLLLGRFRWTTRLCGIAVLVLLRFAAPRVLQVDGTVNGTGLPNIVLRHAPRAPSTDGMVRAAPAATTNDPLAADTLQFLGNHRDGVIASGTLSTNWTLSPPRERWRVPVGAAWSSFSVSGNVAITQEQADDFELVVARDLATARTLWIHTNATRFFEWQGGIGPRATPTIESNRVYVFGGTGFLDCLSLEDGHALWSRNVLRDTHSPNLTWGTSSSPLVLPDSVVVTGGMGKGPTLNAYRKSDGEPLWHSGTNPASYASPILANLLGREVILSVNGGTFTINKPSEGTELFSFPWGDGKRPVASQPVVVATNRVFLSAGYAIGCVLLELKPEAEGRFSATEVWRNRTMKTQFNSAALLDGFLYGIDDGLLACVDIATGKRVWKDGRYGSGQSLLVGDRIVVQNEDGTIALAAAKPDGFVEFARVPALPSKTWNYPTVAGRLLIVRNDKEAACYELP